MPRIAPWLFVLPLACGPLTAVRAEEPRKPPSLEERLRKLEERLAASERARADVASVPSGLALDRLLGLAEVARVKASGFGAAQFTWNLADPPGRKNRNLLRVNDTDHDTATLSYAKLGLYREVAGEGWDAGFRIDVGAGRMVEGVFSLDPDFNGGSEINLVQGYVDLQVPTPLNPLLVRAGRSYGWFGVESLDLPTNPNISLSYFSNFTPYTHGGVSLGMDLAPGVRYTQWMVNGWDTIVDTNRGKSYGGQLTFAPQDTGLTLAANWLVGPEKSNDEADLRWLLELDATWKVVPGTEVRAAIHYGQEEGASLRGKTAKYGGAQVIARQVLIEEDGFARLAVAARVAWWRDQGGSKTGIDQGLLDTTGTLELGVTSWAKLRLEYRRDTSSESRAFLGHRGLVTRRAQDTLGVELSAAF